MYLQIHIQRILKTKKFFQTKITTPKHDNALCTSFTKNVIIPFNAQMYNASQEITFGAFNILFHGSIWPGVVTQFGIVLGQPLSFHPHLPNSYHSYCSHYVAISFLVETAEANLW
jgi:hypothetical protein